MEKERIVATISSYLYEAKDSLYKVCNVILNDNKKMTIVGYFPHLDDGLTYEFIGEYKITLKYGEQFFVESYSKVKETSKDGLVEYLSSDRFLGIGKKTAIKIVDTLGLDAITLILDDISILDKVDGLNKTKKEIIYNVIKENEKIDKTFVDLYSFGLSNKMILKLYDKYGVSAANFIKENPYRLIDEIQGFGFKKCDDLALSIGFLKDDIRRIKAAISYTISHVCYQEGFTYLLKEQLINSLKSLLGNDILDDIIYNAITSLIDDKKIIEIDDKYFDSYLYKCEDTIKNKLIDLKGNSKYKKEDVEKSLLYVEKSLDIEYSIMQRNAIINALSNKLSIITGGPGTGKSTILKGILNTYARLNDASLSDFAMQTKILLASPTGRAAKRMVEATSFKAQTIHKMLGYNYDLTFTYNEYNLLYCSLIIIDEASMLDVMLASSLFKALRKDTIVILVGDSNQLPSVGPGNILADLMDTNIFSITRLTEVMRQKRDSNIIKISNMVLNEKIDFNIFNERKEIFFYDYDTINCINGIYKILDAFIKAGGDLINDIEILAPMYKGVCGIDAINAAIQARYNKEEKMLVREDKLFKKGDKVLQLKNSPEEGIMNGDIGYILDVIKSDGFDALLISFDDRVVTYKSSELENLTLAYAISIHKAQGSEFKNVIMPILPSYQIMLKKKIVYTAITRAKEKLIVLGKLDYFRNSVKNHEYKRQTYLKDLINESDNKKEINNTNLIRINDPLIPFEFLGEYDMEGISPYTFLEDEPNQN